MIDNFFQLVLKFLCLDLPLAPIVFVVSTTENSIKIQWRSSDQKSAITGIT